MLLMGLPGAGWSDRLPSFKEAWDMHLYELASWPSEKPSDALPSDVAPAQVYDSVEETETCFKHGVLEAGLLLSIQDSAAPLQHSDTFLPRFFLRRAEYRGSDIRLDTGMLLHPERAPRTTVNPHFWKWKPVLRWRWKHRDRINLLELQAYLKTLKWRVRCFQIRFLHFLDSQVCLALLVKGRSSSRRVNHVLRKIGALVIAADLLGIHSFCKSEFNPADLPSRGHGS